MTSNQFVFNKKVFYLPIITLLIIWTVYFIEIKFGFNFNKYGIYPKSFQGLRGVILSPFIHGSARHLFNNSMPLVVMLGCLYYFYKPIANKVLVIGLLLTGFLTWSFGRPSYHIGASGVIYFLVSFIFFSGIFRKYYRLVALSLVVVFLYGSMIWYIFPVEEQISWEGHLSGFIVGFLFAIIFKNQGPQPEKFSYSENVEFDKLFDEEGNFVPTQQLDHSENDDSEKSKV